MYSLSVSEAYATGAAVRESDPKELELTHTGILYLDKDLRIKNMNQEVERLFHLEAAKAIGRKAEDVFCDYGEKFLKAISMADTDNYCTNLQIRVADQLTFIDIHAAKIRDAAGKVQGRVVILQDMSALKAAIKQIQTTQMLMSLGELAAGVAHHIRTPLTTISGYLQVMLSRLQDDQYTVRRDVLDTMLGEVSYINRVVKELVLFAKPPVIKEADVSLNRVIEEGMLLVFKQLGGEGIATDKRLDPNLPLLTADRNLMKQAFMNIMQNAVEAMGDTGTMMVKTWYNRDLDMVVVAIADTGAGVTPEILPKVFEPFYTTKLDRMGLGLPIAHRIITEHGGFVNISDGENGGTKVHIYLPVEDKSARQTFIVQQQILNLQ